MVYNLNVHIHNSNESFMFHFTEWEFKKGSKTIATFIYEIIKNINSEPLNEMMINSDFCFSQNKNWVVFKTVHLSKTYLKLWFYYNVNLKLI